MLPSPSATTSPSSSKPLLYSIGIVGHTARRKHYERLAYTTQASHVCIDTGRLGCDQNHYRTWEHLAGCGTRWAVVLEDDAQPVQNFRAQLTEVLHNAPTPIISLYLGRERPPAWQPWILQATLKANRRNACFIEAKRLLHAVGVAIRTDLIPEMLYNTRDLSIPLPIDEAITLWAARHRRAISYCWPSIIDHADLPTLVEHADGKPRTQPRTAWSVGTRRQWHRTLIPTGGKR